MGRWIRSGSGISPGARGLALRAGLALLAGLAGCDRGAKPGAGADRLAMHAPWTRSWESARPPEQTAYLGALDRFAQRYAQQSNELKRAALRTERGQELARLLPRGAVNGWVGVLRELGTTPDGRAHVTLQLADQAWAKTRSDAAADKDERTLIAAASPLYKRLSELEIGTPVVFSGTLVGEAPRDAAADLAQPELIVRFAQIAPLGEKPGAGEPLSTKRDGAPPAASAAETERRGAIEDRPAAAAPQTVDCAERRAYWQRQGQPEWLIRESLKGIGCR